MNLYTTLLFFHVFGLVALFGALVLLQNAGRGLRQARNWDEANPLVDLLRPAAGMFGVGGVLLLVSGLWMTVLQWSFATPWAMIGLVVLILAAVIGGITVGRMAAHLRRLARQSHGSIDDATRATFAGRGTWSTIFAINFAVVGVMWIMTTKPDTLMSIVIPLALAIIGALVGWAVVTPHGVQRPARPPFRHRQPAS